MLKSTLLQRWVCSDAVNAKTSDRPGEMYCRWVWPWNWRRHHSKTNHATDVLQHSVDCNSVAIFIRLAVAASQIREFPRNSPKIRTYCSSRSSKVIDLSANRKRIWDSLIVIIILTVDVSVSPAVFEILTFKARKCLVFPPLPCLTPRSGRTR